MAKDKPSESEGEGEAPPALPVEGAMIAKDNTSEARLRGKLCYR